jgi:hypothetical protein
MTEARTSALSAEEGVPPDSVSRAPPRMINTVSILAPNQPSRRPDVTQVAPTRRGGETREPDLSISTTSNKAKKAEMKIQQKAKKQEAKLEAKRLKAKGAEKGPTAVERLQQLQHLQAEAAIEAEKKRVEAQEVADAAAEQERVEAEMKRMVAEAEARRLQEEAEIEAEMKRIEAENAAKAAAEAEALRLRQAEAEAEKQRLRAEELLRAQEQAAIQLACSRPYSVKVIGIDDSEDHTLYNMQLFNGAGELLVSFSRRYSQFHGAPTAVRANQTPMHNLDA